MQDIPSASIHVSLIVSLFFHLQNEHLQGLLGGLQRLAMHRLVHPHVPAAAPHRGAETTFTGAVRIPWRPA